jgi:hypothetical protein
MIDRPPFCLAPLVQEALSHSLMMLMYRCCLYLGRLLRCQGRRLITLTNISLALLRFGGAFALQALNFVQFEFQKRSTWRHGSFTHSAVHSSPRVCTKNSVSIIMWMMIFRSPTAHTSRVSCEENVRACFKRRDYTPAKHENEILINE